MLAYNSEKYLPESVGNMVGLVDEIIVALDDRTTDNSRALLELLGATVKMYHWNHNYSDAKNFVKSFATGDWIIIYDSDEKINRLDIRTLIERIKKLPVDISAVRLPRKNHYPDWTYDEDDYLKEYYPDPHIIAFRNTKGLDYCSRVHEGIEHSMKRLKLREVYYKDINTHHHAWKGDRKKNEYGVHHYYRALCNIENKKSLDNDMKKGLDFNEKEYGK